MLTGKFFMRKLLIVFVSLFLLICCPAFANDIKVSSMMKFSTINPSPYFKVSTLEPVRLNNRFYPSGTVIMGLVMRVSLPKLGKRDSYIVFWPTTIFDGKHQINISNANIHAEICAYKSLNKKALAGNIAIKSANFFVLGASQGISFTIGAAKASNGQRISSGLKKMYNDSFVSYVEAGSQLDVEVGDILLFKIKNSK